MQFNEVRKYVKGLLKKSFTNKNVLDKISESDDGNILYNGNTIKNTSLLSLSETVLFNGSLNTISTTELLDNINNYDKIIIYHSYNTDNYYKSSEYSVDYLNELYNNNKTIQVCYGNYSHDCSTEIKFNNNQIIIVSSSGEKINRIVGVKYHPSTEIYNGIFPNYNNILITITEQGATWTATEDCVILGRVTQTNNSNGSYVYIDDIEVCGIYHVNSQPMTVCNVYLKKGQTVRTREYGEYNLTVYGLQQSDTKLQQQTYSLEEQVVGTWIDGKPLYQKVINFSPSISLPSMSWVIINRALFPENIYYFIETSGIMEIRTDLSNSSVQAFPLQISIDNNLIEIMQYRNTSMTLSKCIIKYTKTTD